MRNIYITGDLEREVERVERFCREMDTTEDDVLIVLGDASINYKGEVGDTGVKMRLAALPITLFCIHGNHEMRPGRIGTYEEICWQGGIVYQEEKYPNLLFAKDGEIFDFNGKKTLVLGGAYSVDQIYRITRQLGWWPDEQPSEMIKQHVRKQLNKCGWKVDVVLSHTAPRKFVPTEAFLPGIDQKRVDKSTEDWLGRIEKKLRYKEWYCGHFHIEKKIEFLYDSVKQMP